MAHCLRSLPQGESCGATVPILMVVVASAEPALPTTRAAATLSVQDGLDHGSSGSIERETHVLLAPVPSIVKPAPSLEDVAAPSRVPRWAAARAASAL